MFNPSLQCDIGSEYVYRYCVDIVDEICARSRQKSVDFYGLMLVTQRYIMINNDTEFPQAIPCQTVFQQHITCRRALRFFHIFYDQFPKYIAVRCFQHTQANPFNIPQVTNHSFPFYFCTFLQIFFFTKRRHEKAALHTLTFHRLIFGFLHTLFVFFVKRC